MRKLLLFMLVLTITMLFPTIVLANSNPASEEEWLEGQLGKDVYFISKIETPDVSSYEVTIPEGAKWYVVKGGSGETSLVYGVIPAGTTTMTITSDGLINNGGNQPAISHISFFGEKTTPPVDPPVDPPEPPVDPPKPPVDPPTKDDVPQTGSSALVLWWVMVTMAGLGAAGTLLRK